MKKLCGYVSLGVSMKKINYETSTNYEKLVELIKNGREIICFLHDNDYIKLGYAKIENSELYESKIILSVGAQGSGYFQEYEVLDFISSCKKYNLGFIDPNL